MIYHKKSKKFSSWEEANQYTQALKAEGYTDWRLPTKYEAYQLVSLLEIRKSESCSLKQLKGYYWVADSREKAGQWEDIMLCGGNDVHWVESMKGKVWAVRP